MLHGVDVSGHQDGWIPGDDDAFVFVKSTEGRSYHNGSAEAQVHAAREAGLQIGHYHFLWPDNALQQAAYFVAKTDIQPGDLLVCDWEISGGGHPSVADAANFIAEVKRLRPDNKVGLYCNKSDWLDTAVKAGDFLWIAHYTTMPEPGIASPWVFWQHTNTPIDQNKAASRFETLDELKAWAGEKPEPGVFYSEEWRSPYVSFNSSSVRWVTPIDRAIAIACAKASGWGSLRLSQGGLRPASDFSASTHCGLGVADIAVDGRTKDQVWNLVAHLIRSGIIGFPRGFGGDSWADQQHIHWASIESAAHAHQQLRDQIEEYRKGGDGLKGDRPYNGPSVPLGTWAESPYNSANIKADTGVYYVNTNVLNGRDVDNNVVRKRTRGYEIQAAQQVKRWGRWNVVTSTPTYYALDYLEAA